MVKRAIGGFAVDSDAAYLDRRVRVFRRSDGAFDWHRLAANNEIVCQSAQGYENRQDAIGAAEVENPGLEVVLIEDE